MALRLYSPRLNLYQIKTKPQWDWNAGPSTRFDHCFSDTKIKFVPQQHFLIADTVDDWGYLQIEGIYSTRNYCIGTTFLDKIMQTLTGEIIFIK